MKLNGFDYYVYFKILIEKPTCLIVLYPHSSAFLKLLDDALGTPVYRSDKRLLFFRLDSITDSRHHKERSWVRDYQLTKGSVTFDLRFKSIGDEEYNNAILCSTQLETNCQHGRTIGEWRYV